MDEISWWIDYISMWAGEWTDKEAHNAKTGGKIRMEEWLMWSSVSLGISSEINEVIQKVHNERQYAGKAQNANTE